VSGPARLLRLLVLGYRRAVSPLLPPRCRFAPTCSAYALEALEVHGAARGSWLAVRRVARCHPFHPGGHDPVPPSRRHAAGPRRVSDDGRTAPVPPPAAPVLAPVPRLGAPS
jgi:putative membrane protein insertion efficiency factor